MRTLSAAVVFAGVAVAAVGLWGCGGSNPGSGSRTLFVKATAHTDGTSDGTWLGVEVRQGSDQGDLITDAVVTVKGDQTGEFNLGWSGVNWGGWKAGLYLKQKAAWDTGWALSVTRGRDELDAYLAAPGVTTITRPFADTHFRRVDGEPFELEWKDSEGRRAEEVHIDFDHSRADLDLDEDSFSHEFEAGRLASSDREHVRVTRTNTVDLAGGTPGSTFIAESTHQIGFTVE